MTERIFLQVDGLRFSYPECAVLNGLSLAWPPGLALVRGDEVMQVHRDTIIEDGDHVIMFLLDKKLIPEVERLFQPSPFFL